MSRMDVPQPDLALRILPEHGGQSKRKGKYGAGAPELIVEVTMSSHGRDLRAKVSLYERTGVQEYVSVLVSEKRIVWRWLSEGKYRTLPPTGGVFRSRCFPGLWLDPAPLWRSDAAALEAAIDRGVLLPAHAEFVARLNRRTRKSDLIR